MKERIGLDDKRDVYEIYQDFMTVKAKRMRRSHENKWEMKSAKSARKIRHICWR